MLRYLFRRLTAAVPTLLGVMIAVFLVVHLIPGDPVAAMLGDTATTEQMEQTRRDMGLDQPLPVQFGAFMARYFQGDMGSSLRTRRLVVDEISSRFPHTARLALFGGLVSILLGVPLGVLAASRRGSVVDLFSLLLSSAGVAAPVFWVGLLLSLLFAVKLRWFPTVGAGREGDWVAIFRALVLPGVTLGLSGMALIARMTRSCMLEVLREDYIRTARAKGQQERAVIFRHGLRNASIPIVTIIGLNMGYLMGGAVLVETVFARPGLGKLLVDGISARDYPVVQGVTFAVALCFILVNLITDMLYGYLDPRVKAE
jgi:peptide/nickel transport system permease protein